MTPSIYHPTNQPNFSVVEVGGITYWFSYQTCIGFQDDATCTVVARQNHWGTTTGKHLNHFSELSQRVDDETFARLLEAAQRGAIGDETYSR
jgi:hypothetical protein